MALDMYEYAYHMDYGTAAAKYVDKFMAKLNWQQIDRRCRRVSALSALSGSGPPLSFDRSSPIE